MRIAAASALALGAHALNNGLGRVPPMGYNSEPGQREEGCSAPCASTPPPSPTLR